MRESQHRHKTLFTTFKTAKPKTHLPARRKQILQQHASGVNMEFSSQGRPLKPSKKYNCNKHKNKHIQDNKYNAYAARKQQVYNH